MTFYGSISFLLIIKSEFPLLTVSPYPPTIIVAIPGMAIPESKKHYVTIIGNLLLNLDSIYKSAGRGALNNKQSVIL